MKKMEHGKSAIGVILAVLVIVVIGVVYFATQQESGETALTVEDVKMSEEEVMKMSEEEPPMDAGRDVITEETLTMMRNFDYSHEGDLFDVTEGSATGVAKATVEDGMYYMLATFENLPDPETFGAGYFYEGWIVRREPFHFLSTGAVNIENGAGENFYSSTQDWLDHDFYVLTIEPDDDDPAPAGHILEGVMMAK